MISPSADLSAAKWTTDWGQTAPLIDQQLVPVFPIIKKPKFLGDLSGSFGGSVHGVYLSYKWRVGMARLDDGLADIATAGQKIKKSSGGVG
jgi:hypothetical protein